MPQPINVPGEGIINFPDGMSDAQINAEIVKAFPHLGGAKEQALAYAKSPTLGNVETLGQMASGMVATPVAGLSGMAQGAYNVLAPAFGGTEGRPAAQRVEEVQQGLTYQPRSEAGKIASQTVGYPFQKLAEGANYAGERVAEATDSPLIGAAVRAAPDLAMSLLAPEARGAMSAVGRGMVRAAPPAAVAGAAGAGAGTVAGNAAAAQQWATSKGLSWGSLPAETKLALSKVATDASKLDALDPLAVQREANLRKFGMTPTRGMVTRDPLQLQAEQLSKSSDAGSLLRQIDLDNNAALSAAIDSLKSAPAKSARETGESVQNTLRARLDSAKENVKRLYTAAEEAGELQGPVNIDKMVDYLKNHDDPTQVSYVRARLRAIGAIKKGKNGLEATGKPVSLEQLERIRQTAVKRGADGGTAAHYAGEIKDVIDDVTEGAGGDAYKAARQARKLIGDEFERTKIVNQMVSGRGKTNSRATALEQTWDTVVKGGSLDDLVKAKTSLFKSGKQGIAAWDDLRNATIDYIYDKATGGPKNERGQVNVNWNGLSKAIKTIGQDKLEMMIGKTGARQLNEILEATEIAKTQPPYGIKGSPTLDKFIVLMDRLGAVPVLGHGAELVKGAVLGTKKIYDLGKRGREIRKAQGTPLTEAANPPLTLRSMAGSTVRPVVVPGAGSVSQTLAGQPQ